MKNHNSVMKAFAVFSSVVALSNCASTQRKEEDKNISSTGPSILNVHAEPKTIELNRQLEPARPPAVIADIKDFQAPVRDATLQFQHVPLEIQMQRVAGSTWKAVLGPRDLQMLAVSGRTITYEATIIARDEQGKLAISDKPVKVEIKTPDIGKATG